MNGRQDVDYSESLGARAGEGGGREGCCLRDNCYVGRDSGRRSRGRVGLGRDGEYEGGIEEEGKDHL
jgi:hypothetical protein